MRWVEELIPAINMQDRRIEDLPAELPPGVRAVAIVTVSARQQDFAFGPVMKSLELLSQMTSEEWASSKYMVAPPQQKGKYVSFRWQNAPERKYKSFVDFYRRELEPTWGKWENLKALYAKVAKGEISETEAKDILGRRERGIKGGKPGPGRGKKTGVNNTRFNERSSTGRAYIVARLRRDGYDDLADKVDTKEMSARAAAKEAGYPVSKRRCPKCGHEW